MKKTVIAALVGGLIIFLWQFLSYALINFHKPAQQYTEKTGGDPAVPGITKSA